MHGAGTERAVELLGQFTALGGDEFKQAAALQLVVGIEAEHLQGGAVGKDDLSLALDDDGAGRILDQAAVARFALLQAAVHLGQRGERRVEGAAALLDQALHLPAPVEGIRASGRPP